MKGFEIAGQALGSGFQFIHKGKLVMVVPHQTELVIQGENAEDRWEIMKWLEDEIDLFYCCPGKNDQDLTYEKPWKMRVILAPVEVWKDRYPEEGALIDWFEYVNEHPDEPRPPMPKTEGMIL